MMKSFFVLCLWGCAWGALWGEAYEVLDPPEGVFAEDWRVLMVAGQRAGWGHTVLRREGGVVFSEGESLLRVRRGLAVVEMVARTVVRESLEGRILGFRQETWMADESVVAEGEMEDGVMVVALRQGGEVVVERVPLGEEVLMSWGVAREGFLRGWEVGLAYALEVYSPDVQLGAAVAVEVRVVGEETFACWEGQKRRGVRVERLLKTGQYEMLSEDWVGEDGQVWRSRVPYGGFALDAYRVSQEEAQAAFEPVEVFWASLIPVEGEVNPVGAEEVVYRLWREEGGNVEGLPVSRWQEVLGEAEAGGLLVRVRRVNPQVLARERQVLDETMTRYVRRTVFLDTADPRLVTLAAEALEGCSEDVWERAVALRDFVQGFMEEGVLDVGFATASEVAATGRGDCSESAVLLAALGRVDGLATRVVGGLLYLPVYGGRERVMGYHVWTQFWIGGEWVDLDAAEGEAVCEPLRVGLFVSALEDGALTDFGVALVDFVGRLRVAVVSP